jgi:hypothetical protein
MELSETFWFSVAALGAGALGAGMWYAKSILMTSRCLEIECCCIKIRNQPLDDDHVVSVLDHEQPPQTTLSVPGQSRPSSPGMHRTSRYVV